MIDIDHIQKVVEKLSYDDRLLFCAFLKWINDSPSSKEMLGHLLNGNDDELMRLLDEEKGRV